MNDLVVLDRDQFLKPDLEALGLDMLETRYLEADVPLQLGERSRVYYFLSLMSGGLKYQTDLILENPETVQWIIVAGTDNSWAAEGFRNSLSGAKASIHILKAASKSSQQLKTEIASIGRIRDHTCLIYSKRPDMGKRTVSMLLKEKFCPSWNFVICQGTEEDFREQCAGINRVIIMGCSLQDFSLSKPEQLEVKPILFFNRCDEQVQRSIRREFLWEGIQAVLAARDWEFPDKYPDFYMGSALYEKWAAEDAGAAVQSLLMQENFVMWDSFGLPMVKKEYTKDHVTAFLERFHAVRDISRCI